jgi:hypothetical protein
MTERSDRSVTPTPSRGRIALAVLAALLIAGTLAFTILDHRSLSRARASKFSSTANVGALAAQIQTSIADQRERATERSAQVDRHELRDPDDAPPRPEVPAIERVEQVVRRWLSGYLPYEVDHLTAGQRREITVTSTPRFARALLGHRPLIPPTQHAHRPLEGRLLGLITHLGPEAVARVYVEVTYGLEREGFHLSLIRGEHGWLVTGFHG